MSPELVAILSSADAFLEILENNTKLVFFKFIKSLL